MSGEVPDGPTRVTNPVLGVWGGTPGADWLLRGGSAGDFDGDGNADLYFASIECDGSTEGSVYLVRGPSDRWSKAPTYMGDAADARWLEDRPYVCFGEEADAGRDLDGDGMDEIVTWNDYDRVHVLRGRVDPQGTMAAADELWFASDGSPQDAALLPDQDGDGLEDLGFNVEDGDAPKLGWLPGPMGYPAGSLLADVLVTIRSDAGRSFAYAPQGALGDQDTDGYEEVLVWVGVPDSGASPYKTCATWLDGGTPAGGDFTDALGPILCYDDSDGMGAWGDIDPVADVDGDGQTDILWKREDLGDQHGSCLIPSSRLPPSGHVSIGDVSYCFTGGGYSPGIDALADLDGDGLLEFLMNDPYWDGDTGSRYGRVLVAPGFEIPWDDPSAW
jgi:hypothetical protein